MGMGLRKTACYMQDVRKMPREQVRSASRMSDVMLPPEDVGERTGRERACNETYVLAESFLRGVGESDAERDWRCFLVREK